MHAKAIFVAVVAFVLASSVFAAVTQKCEDCETFKAGVHRKVIPVNDLVCIYFVQPTIDDVLLRIDLQNGKSRKYTKKAVGKSGKICVWRGWVSQATTMYVCNSSNHADYSVEDTAFVAQKQKESRDNEACLYGIKKCAEMGYKTR
jgi:hypothetical protein